MTIFIKIYKILMHILFVDSSIDSFWLHRRKALYIKNDIIKKYHRLYYNTIIEKNNAYIPLKINIPKELSLPHGINGVFISIGAIIGSNCTIFHHVTIGSNTLKDTKKGGAPIIGNNVYIGAGAKIIGNIRIGDNCRIGANCVIVDDVPNNCTVVLQKPRIIFHKNVKDNTFKTY